MKKYFLLLVCALFTFSAVHAIADVNLEKQGSAGTFNPNTLQSRWYYGGNIGLNFWKDYTYIGVYPFVGYKVSPQLSVGGKIGYAYISDDRYDHFPSLDTSNYGGSIFGRYRFIPQLYAHSEFGYWSYETIQSFNRSSHSYTTERNWVPFLLLGGGFSQKIGGNTWAFVEVLFDVIQDSKSPYEDWEPLFNFGISVGF